ncbi:hypothetical protein CROQUDRAFT_650134 [Cronartium quercuum f. sp. fusiforme G11]|uniref:Uncharacterized protein n=1 Tax=Cronartium quercuum f. sp. fusiforme G11 TaxID=708437 RepID=A0A9P6NZ67_9BASI|nr:hypothetical protein CROQUDRAFT_650134 [Cronartium quercuum f. sp. fusiforme G11]
MASTNHFRLSTGLQDLPQNTRSTQPNTNTFGPDETEDEEDDDPAGKFDVYKDFNNTGVRYVNVVGSPDEALEKEEFESGSHSTAPEKKPRAAFLLAKESRTKSKANSESPRSDFSPRSPRKIPEVYPKSLKQRWGWRLGAVIAFVSLAGLGLGIYFVVPRQPSISFERPITFVGDSGSAHFNPENSTSFSFDSRLSLYLDGRASFIPGRIRNLQVLVSDLGSTPNSVLVGQGHLAKALKVSTKTLTDLEVDVHFQYTARAQTDALFQAWYQSCGNINASKVNGTVTRPSLQLALVVSFDMLGVIGTRSDSTQLNGVSCPVERPA